MKPETMWSTILSKRFHRILSIRQILLLLLSFQNQKKGRKLQKLQIHLHLHLHWREPRNSFTLQNPKVTADTPAPASALERAEEQSHTPKPQSHYMNQMN